jgi:hypothetical protein
MATEYGFRESGCPLIGARTTWDVEDKSFPKKSETHEYWLCLPVEN